MGGIIPFQGLSLFEKLSPLYPGSPVRILDFAMTPTSSPAAKMSPALRREDAQARRRQSRAAKRLNISGDAVLDISLLAWNALVDIDRMGRMANVNRELSRTFGGGWQKTSNAATIIQVRRDYEERRAKSKNPLRKKTAARMKQLPTAPATDAIIAQVFKAQGINPKNVLHAKLRRLANGGYAVRYTHLEPRKPLDDLKRLTRLKHRGTIQDFGLSFTPTGLDIVVTQANGKKDKAMKVAVKDLIKPGFAQDLFRHVIAPKANTVALDETFVPTLSGPIRNANADMRRWLRSRQAVGAIRFAVVSPVKREIDDALTRAKAVGVSRNTIRLMKVLSVEKCLCGAPVELRLDPVTLIPVLRRTKCVECGAVMDTGHVLATRASAYLLDNWRTHGNAGVLTKRI